LKPDKVNFNYIRPPSADPKEFDIDHSRYAKLAQMIDDDSRHAAIKNNYGGKAGFLQSRDRYLHARPDREDAGNADRADDVLRRDRGRSDLR
jgi:hypothetical protein